MQSYQLHVVSEHLKDRHPYIEAPFNDRYDPSDVFHAVFDRSIPKLIEILLMPDIEQYKYRDALITLNEMVSHQEMKDEMITQGLIAISSAYLHHKVVEIRREAILLLGSLVSIKRGRQQLIEMSFEGMSKMLFDDNLYAREACGWAVCRMTTARDGVDILCNSSLINVMSQSFNKYTEKMTRELAKFNIYLLEAFSRILEYDNGIKYFVNCGVVKRMNQILQDDFDQQFSQRINYLCLDCLAKICGNNEGKQEGIDELIIPTASEFLDSPIYQETQFSTILIMNCSIHLEGKKQCVHVTEDKIISKLINLLDLQESEFKKDVKQALINIAEYPEGFLIITRKLATNLTQLENLFGPKVVIPLSNLLPKTSSLLEPPLVPENDEYLDFVEAICIFMSGYDEALEFAVEDSVKIEEKLLPFLAYSRVNNQVAGTLCKLANYNEQAKQGILSYLQKYGDVDIKIGNNGTTTLNEEVSAYEMLQNVLSN